VGIYGGDCAGVRVERKITELIETRKAVCVVAGANGKALV